MIIKKYHYPQIPKMLWNTKSVWGKNGKQFVSLVDIFDCCFVAKKKTPKKQGKENELRNNVKHSKLSTKFSIEYLEKKTNVCWIYIKEKAKTNEAVTSYDPEDNDEQIGANLRLIF